MAALWASTATWRRSSHMLTSKITSAQNRSSAHLGRCLAVAPMRWSSAAGARDRPIPTATASKTISTPGNALSVGDDLFRDFPPTAGDFVALRGCVCALASSQGQGAAAGDAVDARAADVLRCGAFGRSLGAGKTAVARGLLCAISGDPSLEVASPTFLFEVSYPVKVPDGWLEVHHIDCYRLGDAEGLDTLGFDQSCREGVVLMEWPEVVGDDRLPLQRLDISIAIDEAALQQALEENELDSVARTLTMTAYGDVWTQRLRAIDG